MNFNNDKLRNYDLGVGQELLKDRTRLWICVLLSQMRGPLAPADLLEMLPKEVGEDRSYAMATIRHLYRCTETLEIGHCTLKDFLLEHHPVEMQEGNELLLLFCRNHPEREYSVANTLYHDSLSAYPLNAVLDCTQEWADGLAHHHVKPEWILDDVRRVAEQAVNLQLTTESVRLMLLYRRLCFRYEKTFVEFTEEMCSALIAHGRAGDALQYLIADDGLRVSTDRAFHYLSQLYALQAWEEAGQLRKAIDREYRSELDDSRGFSLFNASLEPQTPWAGIQGGYGRAGKGEADYAPDNIAGGTEQTVEMIWDHCVVWNDPLLLTYGELFAEVSDLKDMFGCAADSSPVWVYAHSALEFTRIFNHNAMKRFPLKEFQTTLAGNMEVLLRMHGAPQEPEELATVIRTLLGHCSDPKLMRGLMVEFLKHETPTSLRAENGVDLNRSSYDLLTLQAQCRGFLHEGEVWDVAPKDWYYKTWESDLEQLIKEIHFHEGRACYLKASGGQETLHAQLDRILDTCRFTFITRSEWERSYQLPEEICPLLCTKIIDLIFEYEYESLPNLLESLTLGSANQLGLYSEGFRKVMGEAVGSLLHLPVAREALLPLIASWENHVLTGIHNRWERTEELLLIYECYGGLDEAEKAAAIYQRMLESSMGPVWHGESEFELITAALHHMETAPADILQKFASLLDFAAGDMTFPNAVKRYKEKFIGTLTSVGELSRAFDYYKFEILPPPEVVLSNAEASSFDAPRKGAGYKLGAGNLSEAGAVIEILKHVTCNPYLRWGLCNVFILSEPMYHPGSAYGKILAEVLNEIEALKDGHINTVCGIIGEFLCTGRIKPAAQQVLLNQLTRHLSATNMERIQGTLPAMSNSMYPVHLWTNGFNTDEHLAEEHTEMGLVHHLVDPLSGMQGAKTQFAAALKQQLDVNPATLPTAELFAAIAQHFHHLIQPDEAVARKYAWLNTDAAPVTADRLVAQLIIWHLNHPSNSLSTRAEETLIHLVALFPEIIEDIVEQCVEDSPEYASELCSTVLYESSKKYAATVGHFLHSRPLLMAKITGIQHLTIRKNLLEAGIHLRYKGYPELYSAVKETLPDRIEECGGAFIPDPSLSSIQDVLDDLNNGHFLDAEFSANISRLMNEYCFPISKNMVKMSDWYVRRSFYKDQWVMGTYDYFVKHALNNAVAHRITKENINIVYEIVNE